jgi:hypothetical protein
MLVRGPRVASVRAGNVITSQRAVNVIARASPTPSSRRAAAGADAAAADATAALGRRACLSLLASAPAALLSFNSAHARTAAGDWSSPGLASNPEDDAGPPFTKTPSGALLQVFEPGNRGDAIAAPELGPDGAVVPGDRLECSYTLRRQNGYFIYSNVEGVSFQPRDVPTGEIELAMGGRCGGVGGADGPGSAPAVIRGLEEALVGLRAGARFRVLVPPALGYTDGGAGALGPLPPTFATKRQLLNHAKEPLLFEVEVLKVKKQRA